MAYRYSGALFYRNFYSSLATAAFHDAFSLYGRPRAYAWDPRDEASMMYAYPVGPARDVSFLSRLNAPLTYELLFSHFSWNENRQRAWIPGQKVPPLFGPIF